MRCKHQGEEEESTFEKKLLKFLKPKMEAFLEEEKLFKKKGKPTSQMGGRCVVGAQSTNRLTKPESLKV